MSVQGGGDSSSLRDRNGDTAALETAQQATAAATGRSHWRERIVLINRHNQCYLNSTALLISSIRAHVSSQVGEIDALYQVPTTDSQMDLFQQEGWKALLKKLEEEASTTA